MMGDNMEKETKKQTKTQKNNTMPKKKGNATKKTANAKKGNSVKTAKTTTKKVSTKKTIPVVEEKKTNKKEKTTEKVIVKEETKKINEEFVTEGNEVTNLIKIVIIVTVIFLLFYLVTYLITKEKSNSNNKNEETEVSINYETILMSNLLTQKSDSYYVLAYESEDLYLETINSFISSYAYSKGVKIYRSDLNSKFNASYYDESAEASNLNADSLKLKTTTLFKISNGRIEKTYEGGEAILDFLVSVIK